MQSEQWIWLPKDLYHNNQTTNFSAFVDWNGGSNVERGNYTVAEFKKRYVFSQTPKLVKLRFSGDTLFQLFCNDEMVATGPASVGGDFLGNDKPKNNFYAYETELHPQCETLNFFARVQMMPDRFCHYSMGHGGFMLGGIAVFADGTTQNFATDDSWFVRKNGAYVTSCKYDGTVSADSFVHAQKIENIWHAKTAPIPVNEEHKIATDGSIVTLAPHEEKVVLLDLDKIHAGFFCAKSSGGVVQVVAKLREPDEDGVTEHVTLCGTDEYRGFFLHSVGNVFATVANLSNEVARVELGVVATNYPIQKQCSTVTSDSELNKVLEVCKHTLKICRQTQHVDSPKHCEPLACTGDYYIESLMTPFSFGDMRLAEFDLLRTANLLENENGRLFHTTYSLIYVRMLWDAHQITGNEQLLRRSEKAVRLVLQRFASYLGSNGLVETPPDFMFVDWIFIDGLSLHHPPKALGQTCMNMFYFGALQAAEKVFATLNLTHDAEDCANRANNLRFAINSQLYDSARGAYFAGLNTKNDGLEGQWMPQNVEKRYYIKHPNILAAYFGVCDDETAKRLVADMVSDKIQGDCQPYFLHFLLEAIFRLGLRNEFTLSVLNRWKWPVSQCTKGLVEGFAPPEPSYKFDHSHAWGGTPLYSLPKALMGLEIVQAGMKKLRLSPSLLGLEFATATLITQYGEVTCRLQKGKPPVITAPTEVEIQLVP